MIKKLKLRFAVICMSLTGLVVVVLMLITLNMAEMQIKNNDEALFLSTVQTLTSKFTSNERIQDSWLAGIESGGYIIAIRDRGKPFFFPGSWSPLTDRSELIEKAEQRASEEYGINAKVEPVSLLQIPHADFSLQGGHGDDYRARVEVFTTDTDWYSIVVLRDLSVQKSMINNARFHYLLVTLAAILALGVISIFLAGRAVASLKESIERQVSFVAAASHELRNPITVIKSGLSVAKDAKPEDKERYFSIMDKELNRLSRLVDDLLLLANSDAKNWKMQFAKVDLEVLLLELADQMLPLALKQKHTLDVSLPDELLPCITADRDRLMQIMVILMTNAIDHTPDGTQITIQAQILKKSVALRVIDNGPGLSPEDEKRVFDRFYSGDKSRTDKRHFGLGLSMAKELTIMHGGRLEFATTPGGGCTFSVVLPLPSRGV